MFEVVVVVVAVVGTSHQGGDGAVVVVVEVIIANKLKKMSKTVEWSSEDGMPVGYKQRLSTWCYWC